MPFVSVSFKQGGGRGKERGGSQASLCVVALQMSSGRKRGPEKKKKKKTLCSRCHSSRPSRLWRLGRKAAGRRREKGERKKGFEHVVYPHLLFLAARSACRSGKGRERGKKEKKGSNGQPWSTPSSPTD